MRRLIRTARNAIMVGLLTLQTVHTAAAYSDGSLVERIDRTKLAVQIRGGLAADSAEVVAFAADSAGVLFAALVTGDIDHKPYRVKFKATKSGLTLGFICEFGEVPDKISFGICEYDHNYYDIVRAWGTGNPRPGSIKLQSILK